MKNSLKNRALISQGWYQFTENLAYALTNKKIDKNIEFIQKISYGNAKTNVANIMYRRDLEDVTKPVFLYIHGGGWISGKLNLRNQYNQEYAKLGFFSYSLDYTVAPQAIYPTPIQEIFNAIDWLYENKDVYHIDMQNILVAGESAGGYFITMLADLKNNPEKMERIGVSSKYINKVNIKALVSICGAFDLKRMVDKTKQQSKFPDMKIFTQAFVGKSGKEFKEWIASENAVDASPQITQSFPPTFLVWASNDKLRYDSFDIMKEFGENNVEYAQFEANKEIANHAWAIITQLPTAKLGLYYTLKFILPKFSKYFEEIDDYWHFKN